MVRRRVCSRLDIAVTTNAPSSSRPEPPEGRRSGGTFLCRVQPEKVPPLRLASLGSGRDGCSVEFHSGRVNDLLPFLDLGADALGELFASLTAKLRRLFLPDGLQLGRLQRLHDLLVHAIDDRLWRALDGPQTIPGRDDPVRHADLG